MKIVISGSHGLVGKALSKALVADSHEVFDLVRQKRRPARATLSGIRTKV